MLKGFKRPFNGLLADFWRPSGPFNGPLKAFSRPRPLKGLLKLFKAKLLKARLKSLFKGLYKGLLMAFGKLFKGLQGLLKAL